MFLSLPPSGEREEYKYHTLFVLDDAELDNIYTGKLL